MPAPTKLDDLEPWWKEWSDKDLARPNDLYTLRIEGAVTLQEFSVATQIFTSRGFVHPVVSTSGPEIDFYSGYVPIEASRPVGRSLTTVNIVIEGDTIYATSIMMLDQWKHQVIEDHRFDLAAVNEGCAGQAATQLARVCGHPRRPCDRILFIGLREAPVVPFLEVLALIRRLLPERTPAVTDGPTVKAGVAARYRDRGSSQFLELEGLIEPIEDSYHQ